MGYCIDKIWKVGVVRQRGTNPDREQRKREDNPKEDDDTISISEEARERWATIESDSNDTVM